MLELTTELLELDDKLNALCEFASLELTTLEVRELTDAVAILELLVELETIAKEEFTALVITTELIELLDCEPRLVFRE